MQTYRRVLRQAQHRLSIQPLPYMHFTKKSTMGLILRLRSAQVLRLRSAQVLRLRSAQVLRLRSAQAQRTAFL
jgi:hypothetical protein